MTVITGFRTADVRYELPAGAGTDAVHTDPLYGYAVTILESDDGSVGTGLNYTLGAGTELVCSAINLLAGTVVGREIEELMSGFGEVQRQMAEHHQLRWLGPHKGVTHAALASLTIACFDLWAKSRGVPLWQLLLNLTPAEIVRLVDLSYCEDVLTCEQALEILEENLSTRGERESVLRDGYPGYDTSVGWMGYSDTRIRENAERAIDAGFTAMKLKVGSPNPEDDVRRVHLIREAAGDDAKIMLDANQAWNLPTALAVCKELVQVNPFFIEEPTQPDDIAAHRAIAEAIAPVHVAAGECIHNRIQWKNFLQAGAVGVVQADCTRLAGISEYLVVALMSKKYPVRVIPHVGDMGQVHQHLVLFNHVALGHEKWFLEHIPHLREHFVHPAVVDGGFYRPPQVPGCSTDLKGV